METQLTSIEDLIKEEYTIAKAKSPLSYIAMIKPLVKEYKALKLQISVEEQEALEGRALTPEQLRIRQTQVNNEVNRSKFLLINIYREVKEHGLTKEIRACHKLCNNLCIVIKYYQGMLIYTLYFI